MKRSKLRRMSEKAVRKLCSAVSILVGKFGESEIPVTYESTAQGESLIVTVMSLKSHDERQNNLANLSSALVRKDGELSTSNHKLKLAETNLDSCKARIAEIERRFREISDELSVARRSLVSDRSEIISLRESCSVISQERNSLKLSVNSVKESTIKIVGEVFYSLEETGRFSGQKGLDSLRKRIVSVIDMSQSLLGDEFIFRRTNGIPPVSENIAAKKASRSTK